MIYMTDNDWKDYARGLLRSEIARRNLNYVDIAERLERIGVHETSQNLSNKIGRGMFGAIFFLQVLHVIGCDELRLDPVRNVRDI
jgi:Domain of unknown function (DUF6471)